MSRGPHEFISVSDQIVALLRDAPGPVAGPDLGRALGFVFTWPCSGGSECKKASPDERSEVLRFTFAEHVCDQDIVARRGMRGAQVRRFLNAMERRGIVERHGFGRGLKWSLTTAVRAELVVLADWTEAAR